MTLKAEIERREKTPIGGDCKVDVEGYGFLKGDAEQDLY